MAVELADLDFGADCGMGDSEPRQSNVLVQHRRAHARCELADLGAADMHAIAMADRHVGVDVEADEFAQRIVLAPDQRFAADESSVLVFSRMVKPMPASNGSLWSKNS